MFVYVCVCASACARVALLTQNETHRHIAISGLHHIFRHYLINGTIFGKKLLELKYVLWFSLQVLPEAFPVPRRTQRDTVMDVKKLYVQ